MYRPSDRLDIEEFKYAISRKSEVGFSSNDANGNPDSTENDSSKSSDREINCSSLREWVDKLKTSFQKQTLQTLANVAYYRELSTRQAADLSGERMSTEHGRLMKILKQGFFIRERKYTEDETHEYFYSLGSIISSNEVLSLAREYEIFPNSSDIPEELIENKMKNDEPASQKFRSYAELLIQKFPDFSPEWTEELQKKWFESFRELIEISPR